MKKGQIFQLFYLPKIACLEMRKLKLHNLGGSVLYDMTAEMLLNTMLKCLLVTDIFFFAVSDHTSAFIVQKAWSLEGFRGVVLGHSGQFSQFLV
jgi:hypothetical protein